MVYEMFTIDDFFVYFLQKTKIFPDSVVSVVFEEIFYWFVVYESISDKNFVNLQHQPKQCRLTFLNKANFFYAD